MNQSARSDLRRVGEIVVGMLMLAIVLRTWVVQGIVLPVAVHGGSMASALRGAHRVLLCGRCGHEFACGLDQLPSSGRAECPNCGWQQVDATHRADVAGERLLIDRVCYQFRAPQRWELVVFRNPDQPQQLCIKRVVGLPGETIEIRGGEVYADGRLVQKSLAESRSLAHLVFRAHCPLDYTRKEINRFRPAAKNSRWQATKTGYTHDASSDAAVDWLVYHHADHSPVRNDSGYNQSASWRLSPVADVKLSCRITFRQPGVLWLRAIDRDKRFTAQLDFAQRRIALWENEILVHEAALPTVDFLSGELTDVRLEWLLLDGQVIAALNHQILLAYSYQGAAQYVEPSIKPLAIGVRDAAVEIANIEVGRDVCYTPGDRRPRRGPWRLGEGEFFVLGDNSPISFDSRQLASPGVSVKFLIGKPLVLR